MSAKALVADDTAANEPKCPLGSRLTLDEVRRVVGLLAVYKRNVLHLH